MAYENHTSHPAPGDIILHPGGISETEILLAYGAACFSSKVGRLAGNHFLTIVKGPENLPPPASTLMIVSDFTRPGRMNEPAMATPPQIC